MEITTTSENEKHSSTITLPLLSRIDRLETAMRRLEMKQSSFSPGCSSSTANNTFSPSSGLTSEHQQPQLPQGFDLDMALKEISFKGSLLERIKTLENRLFQLRLRVESDKLEVRARREQLSSTCSFPIFTMNHQSKVAVPNASMIMKKTEFQSTLQEKEQEEITSCKEDELEKSRKQKKTNKKKKSKSENGDGDKSVRKRKKKVVRDAEREKIKSPNWSHFRILGC